jgi:hypothetical protein
MPVEVLVEAVTTSPGHAPDRIRVHADHDGALFVNFVWFREQTCIVLCPYGRLQAALYDADTVLVGYDQRRGEPRGAAGTAGAGDCVDCYRCVAVCPTGHRHPQGNADGMRGLRQLHRSVRRGHAEAATPARARALRQPARFRDGKRRFLRGPRRDVRGAHAHGAVGLRVRRDAATSVRGRPLARPGPVYTVEADRVHNVFQLHIVNKRPGPRTFKIVGAGSAGADTTVGQTEVALESLADIKIPVHVFVPASAFKTGTKTQLSIACDEPGGELTRLATAPAAGASSGRR